MIQFKPASGLSNRHLQSILSSVGPRKLLEKKRALPLLQRSQKHLITTPQGVQLLGYISKQDAPSKGLAIIIHGWEGSADSLYVLSCGQKLFAEGFDVFRLNLRDHGGTHHLNKGLFKSTQLQEVLEAVDYICNKFGGQHNLLCGYSLGGNFCLRVANLAKAHKIALHQAIAVCPVLHPATTMGALHSGLAVYEKYFIAKWKKSLLKKCIYHPHYRYHAILKKLKTLHEMHDFFVAEYTDFNSCADYFEAYSLIGDGLKHLAIPTTIITSKDDPMIPENQLSSLYTSKWLSIDLQEKGGHCAFIKNWKFESWASERIAELAGSY